MHFTCEDHEDVGTLLYIKTFAYISSVMQQLMYSYPLTLTGQYIYIGSQNLLEFETTHFLRDPISTTSCVYIKTLNK